MSDWVKLILKIAFAIAVAIGILYIAKLGGEKAARPCIEKGGVYLSREGVCISKTSIIPTK